MLVLPVKNQFLFFFLKWPERGRIIKMQPLGVIRGLEADASCQEEEDEEEEAVWLREQGHCKMCVQDHPFQGSVIGCSSNRRGRLPGVVGEARESRRSVCHGGWEVGVGHWAGQRRGAGSRQP